MRLYLNKIALAALLVCGLAMPAWAQDSRDIDAYPETGTHHPDLSEVYALDMAAMADRTLVIAYVERIDREKWPDRSDHLVVAKREPGDDRFTQLYASYMWMRSDAIYDIAIAVPPEIKGDKYHDRVFILTAARSAWECQYPPYDCDSQYVYLDSVSLYGNNSIAYLQNLRKLPVRTRAEQLAVSPTITLVESDAADGGFYVVTAFQGQSEEGNPEGEVHLQVFDDYGFRQLSDTIIAGGASKLQSGSYIRPDLTNDGSGRWLLAMENASNGRSRVAQALASEYADYDSGRSVDFVYYPSQDCTWPAIDFDAGQFDMVCLGREGARGRDLDFHVGAPEFDLFDYRGNIFEDCQGSPDIAIRGNNASYVTASCTDPDTGEYAIFAIETDRTGEVLPGGGNGRALVRINDVETQDQWPRVVSMDDGRPEWANGRSLYGYVVDRDVSNESPEYFELIMIDP